MTHALILFGLILLVVLRVGLPLLLTLALGAVSTRLAQRAEAGAPAAHARRAVSAPSGATV